MAEKHVLSAHRVAERAALHKILDATVPGRGANLGRALLPPGAVAIPPLQRLWSVIRPSAAPPPPSDATLAEQLAELQAKVDRYREIAVGAVERASAVVQTMLPEVAESTHVLMEAAVDEAPISKEQGVEERKQGEMDSAQQGAVEEAGIKLVALVHEMARNADTLNSIHRLLHLEMKQADQESVAFRALVSELQAAYAARVRAESSAAQLVQYKGKLLQLLGHAERLVAQAQDRVRKDQERKSAALLAAQSKPSAWWRDQVFGSHRAVKVKRIEKAKPAPTTMVVQPPPPPVTPPMEQEACVTIEELQKGWALLAQLDSLGEDDGSDGTTVGKSCCL